MPRLDEKFTSHLLNSGDVLALGFQEGVVILRIRNSIVSQFSDLNKDAKAKFVINQETEDAIGLQPRGTSGDSVAFFELKDDKGKEIIHTDTGFVVIQAFIGLNDPDLYLYRQLNGRPLGEMGELGNPQVGGVHGFISGEQSPFPPGGPTGFSKVYVLNNIKLECGFWNTSDEIMQPLLYVVNNELYVDPIDPTEPENIRFIKNILTSRIPAEKWASHIKNPIEYDIKTHFNVEPINWKSSKEFSVGKKTYQLIGSKGVF